MGFSLFLFFLHSVGFSADHSCVAFDTCGIEGEKESSSAHPSIHPSVSPPWNPTFRFSQKASGYFYLWGGTIQCTVRVALGFINGRWTIAIGRLCSCQTVKFVTGSPLFAVSCSPPRRQSPSYQNESNCAVRSLINGPDWVTRAGSSSPIKVERERRECHPLTAQRTRETFSEIYTYT